MRLKQEQIEKLSQILLRELTDKDLAKLKVEEAKVLSRIQQVLTADLEAEDRLDREVKELMDQFRPQIEAGQLNERELFQKIKRELAKKKKVVL